MTQLRLTAPAALVTVCALVGAQEVLTPSGAARTDGRWAMFSKQGVVKP